MDELNITIDFINIDPYKQTAIKRITNLDSGKFEDIEISYFEVPGIMRPVPIPKDWG